MTHWILSGNLMCVGITGGYFVKSITEGNLGLAFLWLVILFMNSSAVISEVIK